MTNSVKQFLSITGESNWKAGYIEDARIEGIKADFAAIPARYVDVTPREPRSDQMRILRKSTDGVTTYLMTGGVIGFASAARHSPLSDDAPPSLQLSFSKTNEGFPPDKYGESGTDSGGDERFWIRFYGARELAEVTEFLKVVLTDQ
jgi:hypothetical protein